MGPISLTIAVAALALEASLLFRAYQCGSLHRFPLFYTYVVYVFLISAVMLILYYAIHRYYWSAYWFCLMLMFVAEFAVLLETSDHIFKPYPLIQRLGRFLALSICLVFLSVFILPALLEYRSRPDALFELTRTAALTKAGVILALLGAASLYQLPLGRNISGMLLGFATYLAVTVANVALAETLGPALYRSVFAVVGPLSFVLALCIWNVALWQYEPVGASPRGAPEPSGEGLARHHAELMRLFRR